MSRWDWCISRGRGVIHGIDFSRSGDCLKISLE